MKYLTFSFALALLLMTTAQAATEIVMHPGEKYKISVLVDHPEKVVYDELSLGFKHVGTGMLDDDYVGGAGLKLNPHNNRLEGELEVPGVFQNRESETTVETDLRIFLMDAAGNGAFAGKSTPDTAKVDVEMNAHVVDYKIDNKPPVFVSGSATRVNETTLKVEADVLDDSGVGSYLFFTTSGASQGVDCVADASQAALKHCSMSLELPKVIVSDEIPNGNMMFEDEAGNQLNVKITADGKAEAGKSAMACEWPHDSEATLLAKTYKEKFKVTDVQVKGSIRKHAITIYFRAVGPFTTPYLQVDLMSKNEGADLSHVKVKCSARVGDAASDCIAVVKVPYAVNNKPKKLQFFISSDASNQQSFSKTVDLNEFAFLKQIPVSKVAPKILDVQMVRVK